MAGKYGIVGDFFGIGGPSKGFGERKTSTANNTLDAAEADPRFASENERRQRGIEQARAIAAEVRSGVRSVGEAGDKGRGLMRRQAAQGLAAGIGATAGRAAGAGKIGALQQGALDQGARQAEFEVGQAGRMSEARLKAARADLEATTFEQEATKDFSAEREKMGAAAQEIINKFKGTFNDDEAGAAKRLETELLPTITDPVLRNQLKQRIRDIRSGAEDI